MVVALRAAIALTIQTAHRFVRIMWSRPVSFATAIAKRIARTTMPVPMTLPPEMQPPVIFNALTRLFYPASIQTGAARPGAILSLIMIANPFVVTR